MPKWRTRNNIYARRATSQDSLSFAKTQSYWVIQFVWRCKIKQEQPHGGGPWESTRNLLRTYAVCAIFLWQMINNKTSMKVLERILTPAIAVSDILMFQNFYLEYIGQGHWVKHAQWCDSTVNINVYGSHATHLCANSSRFRDINVIQFWHWKFGLRSPRVKFPVMLFVL